MNFLTRLVRADESRKTRLHTSKGDVSLNLIDFSLSLRTTLARHVWKKLPDVPWLSYPAIRALEKLLPGRRLFEFGSGTSTEWYAQRCSEVISIENNEIWAERTKAALVGYSNARVIVETNEDGFIAGIGKVGGKFDAVVIDSQPSIQAEGPRDASSTDLHRVACLLNALVYAKENCVFIIDNTDAYRVLDSEIDKHFKKSEIHRLPGWLPGILHPCETTIVVRS